MKRFGGIDILAAHAGIAEPRPFLEIDADHWRNHMAINLDGALFCAVHAARAMRDSGRRGGKVGLAGESHIIPDAGEQLPEAEGALVDEPARRHG